MSHNVAALFNRYLRTMKPVAMMTVTMTIAQKTKTPLMKITTMSQIQTNLLVKIGQTWKGKQKKMMKSMKTKKGEVTNLHTDHHTKTGDQKITLYLSLKFFQKINYCLISRIKISIAYCFAYLQIPSKKPPRLQPSFKQQKWTPLIIQR